MSFARRAIEQAFRREYGRVLASLVPLAGDLSEAEDWVSDAFQQALVHWPSSGIPERPGAWLLTVARNRGKERFRHLEMAERKTELVREVHTPWSPPLSDDEPDYPDERLKLIFTCCHPALDEASRIALTLRTLGGLTTDEIARSFLVSETTMAQRLVRAKKKIQAAAIPYAVPETAHLKERLDSVFKVLYLIFTEGYRATQGDEWVRRELCEEAIALGTALNTLVPDQPEALGLEALMRFHHARRDARQDAHGIVLLEAQDRNKWRHDEIATAHEKLERALSIGPVESYQLQAAIAAYHASAPTFEQTDWAHIVALYDRLLSLEPSPVVALNRAAAIGMSEGPERGLMVMRQAGLARALDGFAPYHSARGELLLRSGDSQAAFQAYSRALELVGQGPERGLIERKLDSCAKSLS